MRRDYNGPSPEAGGYQLRELEEITEYNIHHSGSDAYFNDQTWEQTLDAFARHQVGTNGWPAIAYAFIARPDQEEIAWVGELSTIRYHAGGARHPRYNVGVNNVNGLAICIAGNYMGKNPDAPTLARVSRLINWLETILPPASRRIIGHQDVSATACPGDGWQEWRLSLPSCLED